MSFDLKLSNGDLVLNGSGNLQTVANDKKLIQDILKILFTATGENITHPWYGTPLLTKAIGNGFDLDLLEAEIQSSVEYGLNNLKTLQELQERDNQFVTPKELISRIESITAELDPIDSRKLAINVKVRARSNELVSESFMMSL